MSFIFGKSEIEALDVGLERLVADEIPCGPILFQLVDLPGQRPGPHAETDGEIDLFGHTPLTQAQSV